MHPAANQKTTCEEVKEQKHRRDMGTKEKGKHLKLFSGIVI